MIYLVPLNSQKYKRKFLKFILHIWFIARFGSIFFLWINGSPLFSDLPTGLNPLCTSYIPLFLPPLTSCAFSFLFSFFSIFSITTKLDLFLLSNQHDVVSKILIPSFSHDFFATFLNLQKHKRRKKGFRVKVYTSKTYYNKVRVEQLQKNKFPWP